MKSLFSTLITVLCLLTASTASAQSPSNPFSDPKTLSTGRDYSGGTMDLIYQGRFSDLPYPNSSDRNAALAVIIFDFFRGLKNGADYFAFFKVCLPGGGEEYDWDRTRTQKDIYGNVLRKDNEKFREYIPASMLPMYKKYHQHLNGDSSTAYWGGTDLVAKFGCGSDTYSHMLKQIDVLAGFLVDGFPEVSNESVRLSRAAKIQFLKYCMRPHGKRLSEYLNCSCRAYIAAKIYTDAEAYSLSGGTGSDAGLTSDALIKELKQAYKRECRGRYHAIENYRPEIQAFARDMVKDM